MTRKGLLIALPSSARLPSFSDSPLNPCQLRNRIRRLNPSTVTLHIICRDLASRVPVNFTWKDPHGVLCMVFRKSHAVL